MKTAKIHGLKLGNPATKTHKMVNSQTKSRKFIVGGAHPLMTPKTEPAVFDIEYIKNVWNKLVKFFK